LAILFLAFHDFNLYKIYWR